VELTFAKISQLNSVRKVEKEVSWYRTNTW